MRRLVPCSPPPFWLSPPPPPPRSPWTPRDGTRTRVTQLPELEVTVTRTPEPLERVPFAVGVLGRDELVAGPADGRHRRGAQQPARASSSRTATTTRSTSGSRSAASAAARTSGCAGSRSCSTGSPRPCRTARASSPTWTSPSLERAEVLRGASSSLYGNASGGVISLPDRARGPGAVRPAGASAGRRREARGRRLLQVAELDLGPLGRRERHALDLPVQGRRVPAAQRGRVPAAQRRRRLGDRAARPSGPSGSAWPTIRRRRTPARSRRPNTTSIPIPPPPNNILRGADKDVQQQQLALGLKHFDAAGNEYDVTVFGLLRDLENPLAAPPDIGGGPTKGTYVRHRPRGGRRSGSPWRARSAAGAGTAAHRRAWTLQRMRDDRQNLVSDGGEPTIDGLPRPARAGDRAGTVRAAAMEPRTNGCSSAAGPGTTGSDSASTTTSCPTATTAGTATMSALSGNIGASWSFGDQFVPYVNVSTSFETPTTTELVNQPDGSGRVQSGPGAAARGHLRGRRARDGRRPT